MKTKPKLAFLLIVVFQVLVLVGLIAFNEVAFANGQSVVLQTAPVDPRDMFRGDYVVLRYQISTLVETPGVWMLQPGRKAYIRLEKNGEVWDAAEVTSEPDTAGKWRAYITGEVASAGSGRAVIEYGIGQYFVPEGEGLAIQNARDLKVKVKLNAGGQAAIENLIVDGETYRTK